MARRARRRRVGVGLLAGLEAGFADGGGDDSGHAEDEEEAEDGEDGAEGAVHPEGGDGDGGDGDGGGAVAGGAGDVEANLPGAGGHDPDGAGVEGWVGGGELHGVRGGWMFGGFAGEG